MAIKYTTSLKYLGVTLELLNSLPLNSRVDHLTLCHVFKMKNGRSPQYMREHFIPQDGVHTYNIRLSSKGAFVIPKV